MLGLTLLAIGCGDDSTPSPSDGTTSDGTSSSGGVDTLPPLTTTDPDTTAGTDSGTTASTDPDTTAGDTESETDTEGVDDPPGPVTEFAAEPNATSGIDLTWLNPSDRDLAGILVVRRDAVAVDFAPTDGTEYSVDDDLGDGQTVLATALDTAASLDETVPGLGYEFAAWAYDEALQYSPIANTAGTQNRLGPQLAQIEVDVVAQTVTVNMQPEDLVLEGTAVYDAGTDTIDVDLGVTNNAARLVFNLKGLTSNFNQGVDGAPPSPHDPANRPMTYFGPQAHDTGATVNRNVRITGVDGSVNPVTFEIAFVDAPMMFGGNFGGDWVTLDTSGSGFTNGFVLDAEPAGANLRQGAVTPDGRFVYAGEKQSRFLSIIDTTTMDVVGGADLGSAANGIGNVGGVDISADGQRVFVALNDGVHYHGWPANERGEDGANSASFIELDSDLNVVATLPITTDEVGRVGREVHISPDGSTAAVVVSAGRAGPGVVNELWFFDLDAFAVIDTDAATAGDQPVTLIEQAAFAEYAVWNEDGSAVYVAFNGRDSATDVPIDVVDATAYSVSQLIPASGGEKAGPMAFANGFLYYPSRDGSAATSVTVFDIAAGTQTDLDLGSGTQSTGVVYSALLDRLFVANFGVVSFLNADNTQFDLNNDPADGMTNLLAPEQLRAHVFGITPF